MEEIDKIKLNHPEQIAVSESMDTLSKYIIKKKYNQTDKVLYTEFQRLLNQYFDINLNNKV